MRTPALLLGLLILCFSAAADEPPPRAPPPARRDVLYRGVFVPTVGSSGRTLVHVDPVEAALVAGTWKPPSAGDAVPAADGSTKTWAAVEANGEGVFDGERFSAPGTYLSLRATADAEAIRVLHAVGHDFVYVNGALRPGDPYGTGVLRLPVRLAKGENEFLFRVSRGRMTAALEDPPADVWVSADDATVPDVPVGRQREEGAEYGAVVVVNATPRVAGGLTLTARSALGAPSEPLPVSPIPPLSLEKCPFSMPFLPPAAVRQAGTASIEVAVSGPSPDDVPRSTRPATVSVRVVAPDAAHRRTFVSGIDFSVQSYAVLPAKGPARALFLSLHGAGVDALVQAESYGPSSWRTVVAPTNRRPFGFDWEDWGRMDALEVLDVASRALRPDPSQVYLTGHSMGGHGTWQLGCLFPDRFAAIGPSAGWISFSTYASPASGEPKGDVEKMLRRAGSPSDTAALAENLAPTGVYVLHGDADDNVPVSEAKAMLARLAPFHRDVRSHFQPGAGHWWDASDEPGVDCVDWAPMADFFARRRLPGPESVREVDFTTPDPSVSARAWWATVEQQERSRVLSRVRLRRDPGARRFSGTTENVRRLRLQPEASADAATWTVALDGGKPIEVAVPAGPAPQIGLLKGPDGWRAQDAVPAAEKTPERGGPFKAVFRAGALLVYGTRGSDAENAWSLAKARLDAETFYVLGNGRLSLVPDREVVAGGLEGRNLVLYGNADVNAAWPVLLSDAPILVQRGAVKMAGRLLEGDDLACAFVFPLPRGAAGSVGVVAGTGAAGQRLCDRLPYFRSGIHFPDVIVIGSDMLAKGVAGVRLAGFFGPDWRVETGEWAR